MVSLRQEEILDVLRIRGLCTIGELSEEFGVSDETIRRNVRKLAADGVVEQVRGGVALPKLVHALRFERIDTLITEAAPDDPFRARLGRAGACLLIGDPIAAATIQ